jgi:flagellar L-ring protein precursor FlgH
MRLSRKLAAALVIMAASACPALAQTSLWAKGAGISKSVKSRDFAVHDIVHVTVVVSAESTTDEKVEYEKNSSSKMDIDQYLKLVKSGSIIPDLKSVSPTDLGLNMTAAKSFDGDGNSEREDALRTRLAAEIVEIKPNGNLVIEAKSRFTKSREKTLITLTGTVRPQDVDSENNVYSYNIADIDINYESSGPVTDANRRGWLQRTLDKLWPF